MHERLETDGLAVSRWPVEDEAALPGDAELLVDVSTVEELVRYVDELFLLVRVEDHAVPAHLLDFVPEVLVFSPEAVVDVDDVLVAREPVADSRDERVCDSGMAERGLSFEGLLQDVLDVWSYSIQNEVLAAPFVMVHGEGDGLAHGSAFTSLDPWDEASVSDDILVLNVKFCGSVSGSRE